jgi:hypothetical protein
MTALKAATAKLGAPKVEGMETVSGKNAAALYFGATKINNNFDVVDAVVKEKRRDRHAVPEDRRRIRSRFHERPKARW